MSSAPDVRQVRAALFLSIGLGVVGVYGVTGGLGELHLQSNRPSAPPTTGDPAVDATNSFVFAAQELMLDAPYGGALASMNLVASAMLVIGSFMVSSRSRNAVWWVRNATVANALYVALDTLTKGLHFRANAGRLTPLLRTLLEANGETSAAATDAATLSGALVMIAAGVVGVALVRIAIEWLLFWRVGSAPVRAFLATGTPESE